MTPALVSGGAGYATVVVLVLVATRRANRAARAA
jgi:hypothetical protein